MSFRGRGRDRSALRRIAGRGLAMAMGAAMAVVAGLPAAPAPRVAVCHRGPAVGTV